MTKSFLHVAGEDRQMTTGWYMWLTSVFMTNRNSIWWIVKKKNERDGERESEECLFISRWNWLFQDGRHTGVSPYVTAIFVVRHSVLWVAVCDAIWQYPGNKCGPVRVQPMSRKTVSVCNEWPRRMRPEPRRWDCAPRLKDSELPLCDSQSPGKTPRRDRGEAGREWSRSCRSSQLLTREHQKERGRRVSKTRKLRLFFILCQKPAFVRFALSKRLWINARYYERVC